MSSLQIPEEALERLWRSSGHKVPSDLGDLISFMQSLRKPLWTRYESCLKDYESYASFCKSINATPEDTQSPNPDGGDNALLELAGSYDTTHSEDLLRVIPVTFAGLERMRATARALRDLDRVIELLTKIKDRFATVAGPKNQELRLVISSHGKGLAFQLLYDLNPTSVRAEGKARESAALAKPTAAQGMGPEDVKKWIDYGLKALAWKSKDTDQLLSSDEKKGVSSA